MRENLINCETKIPLNVFLGERASKMRLSCLRGHRNTRTPFSSSSSFLLLSSSKGSQSLRYSRTSVLWFGPFVQIVIFPKIMHFSTRWNKYLSHFFFLPKQLNSRYIASIMSASLDFGNPAFIGSLNLGRTKGIYAWPSPHLPGFVPSFLPMMGEQHYYWVMGVDF